MFYRNALALDFCTEGVSNGLDFKWTSGLPGDFLFTWRLLGRPESKKASFYSLVGRLKTKNRVAD